MKLSRPFLLNNPKRIFKLFIFNNILNYLEKGTRLAYLLLVKSLPGGEKIFDGKASI